MTVYIYILFGAAWKLIDGSSLSPKGWNLLLIPYVCTSAYLGLGLASAIACISILDGFQDWKNYSYMSMRFTGYAALATLAHESTDLLYVILCFAAGLLYPVFSMVSAHSPILSYKWFLFDGYESYARTISGAVVLGGVVLL